jgi:hypothetical protein
LQHSVLGQQGRLALVLVVVIHLWKPQVVQLQLMATTKFTRLHHLVHLPLQRLAKRVRLNI